MANYKIMKAFVTIFLLLSSFCLSFSQGSYQIAQAVDFFRINKMQSGDWSKTLSESDIKGSPYLNDDFIKGTIFTTSKFQYVDVPLRYNIYNDNLEFKTTEDQVMAIAAPEIVEKVQLGNDVMAYIPYTNVKKIRRGFFKLLEEGQASLYAKSEVLYKEPEEPGAYKEAEPARFINKPDTYYIRIGLEQAKLISNKNELLDAFPDHQEEIAAFIKKNKIKPTKPEKLQALVQYYNSL
jgi:hypothetical protein